MNTGTRSGTGVYINRSNFRENTNKGTVPSQPEAPLTSSPQQSPAGENSGVQDGSTDTSSTQPPAESAAIRTSVESCSTPTARTSSVPPGVTRSSSSTSSSASQAGVPSRRITCPGFGLAAQGSPQAPTSRHSFDQSWVGTRGNRRNLDGSRGSRASRSSPLPTIQQQQPSPPPHPPPPPPPPPPQQRLTDYDITGLLSVGQSGAGAGSLGARSVTNSPAPFSAAADRQAAAGTWRAHSGPLPSPRAMGLQAGTPAASPTVTTALQPAPVASSPSPALRSAAASGGVGAAAAGTALQLLAGSSSGQPRWALVADAGDSSAAGAASSSARPASTGNVSTSSVNETILQLRSRLNAARVAAEAPPGPQAAAGSGDLSAAAAAAAVVGSSASTLISVSSLPPLTENAGGGGRVGSRRSHMRLSLDTPVSTGTASGDISVLLQQLQLTQQEQQQQHEQQQQQQQQRHQQQMMLGRQASGGLSSGLSRSVRSSPLPLPYGSASLLLQGSPVLQAASVNSISAPVGLPAGMSVSALGGQQGGQQGRIGASPEAQFEGGFDVRALAVGAVRERLTEMQEIEGRHQQLYEEVLALLPLI